MNDQVEPAAELSAIDVMGIMEMIPHRYPFLLIDRVVEMRANVSAVGVKNVTINEAFFQGHFPRQPVMPGVLIIEAMAQTAGVLVVHTLEGAAAGKLVYFMAIDEARFRKPVFPGDTLRILVEKERNRGNVWKFSGQAMVEEKLVAQARFAAMIMDD